MALFLPPANRALAEVLLNYLHMVSQHSSVNKMDTKNLAVCLAPTLFRDNLCVLLCPAMACPGQDGTADTP